MNPPKPVKDSGKYKIVIWCPDCTGEDMMGCFEGGTETLEERFDSKEKAEEFGWEYIKNSIWKFDIESDNGGPEVK